MKLAFLIMVIIVVFTFLLVLYNNFSNKKEIVKKTNYLFLSSICVSMLIIILLGEIGFDEKYFKLIPLASISSFMLLKLFKKNKDIQTKKITF